MDMYIIKIAVTRFAELLQMLILIRCILSWIRIRRNGPAGPFIQLLYMLTDPIILPIRALLDKSPLGGGAGSSGAMLDFSPIIAMLLIGLVHRLLMAMM